MSTFKVKIDIHVFAKSRRVIISVGSRISERLQDVIRLKKNIFYPLDLILLCHICDLV